MPTWNFDSYCNDNVMEYIEQYSKDELFQRIESDMMDFLDDTNDERTLEFILGISIYAIRIGKEFSKKNLLILKEIIDFLISNGKFKYWIDKEKRLIKLSHEKKIILNILLKKNVKFGKIIEKPTNFSNLNDDY